MGVYYHYINHTKHEYFAISALGGGTKFGSIGRTLAARAFELMITKHDAVTHGSTHAIFGRWHGDQVAIEGDDHNPDWDRIANEFRNIGPHLIVMLHEVDGFEPIAEAASDDDRLFMQLSHLIITGQTPQLEDEMLKAFGEQFRQRHADLWEKANWFVPQDLSLAGEE